MMPLAYSVRFPSTDAPVAGAADFEVGEYGVRPRRLPRWTRRQIPDPVFDFVIGMTSGVRVVTRTCASTIELELAVIGIDPLVAAPAAAMLELVVDGEVVDARVIDTAQQSLITPAGELSQQHTPVKVRFTGLGSREKNIELWLPHTTAVELVALHTDAVVAAPNDVRPRWVHHGSSISQCGEASAPTKTWPAVAAAAGGVHLHSLGFSGNAVGDPFVARTIRDLPADAISVEIGINVVNADLMRRRMFEPVLHGFLDTIREGHPQTPLVIIGPIPCPAVEEVPGPTMLDPATGQCFSAGDPVQLGQGAMSLQVVRESILRVISSRADDPELSYLDGRVLLPDDEIDDLDDGLHPNAAAYLRMGQRFAEHAFAGAGPLAQR